MTTNHLLPVLLILIFGAIIGAPVGLFVFARRRIKTGTAASPTKKTLWITLFVVSLLPILCVAFSILWFAAHNFPFTSGIIAGGSAPTGEEICVVQTFKGVEPYQVSLYARRPGQPWIWHYLAHQDGRWRSCHIEFQGDTLRLYTGSTLRRTFSLAAITVLPKDSRYQIPANFTPQEILHHHNKYYRVRDTRR